MITSKRMQEIDDLFEQYYESHQTDNNLLWKEIAANIGMSKEEIENWQNEMDKRLEKLQREYGFIGESEIG